MSSKSNEKDYLSEMAEGPKEFIRESIHLINRCKKPDQKEFIKVSQAVGVGFFIMGFIGFLIKLIHIPINNIIVGGT